MNLTKVLIVLMVLSFVPKMFTADTEPSLVGRWNLAINIAGTQPGFVHTLTMVHEAMYNALTFYDPKATSNPPIDIPCRPEAEWTTENKGVAVSYAAYYTMITLLPDFTYHFDELMQTLGLGTETYPTDLTTPEGIGARCAKETLKYHADDNSNYLGNLNPSGVPYSEPILLPEYKRFKPVNTVDKLKNINYWQPLRNPDGSAQVFPFDFDVVKSFALASHSQFRPKAPKRTFTDLKGFKAQFKKIYNIGLNLTPKERLIALFWDGALEPGLNVWHALTTRVAALKNYTLDEEVKLFYAESAAIFDACIASFDTKRYYDSVRPITAIRYYFDPNWQTVISTPPHPDYTSTHAAVVAAITKVFQEFTGSDNFGGSYRDEATGIILKWNTFSQVAWEAGMSRLYGGIHTENAFKIGRSQGEKVGRVVWKKLKHLFGKN